MEQVKPAAPRHQELTNGQLQLPGSVVRLHQACNSNSPYTFVRILASQLGSVLDAPRHALLQLGVGDASLSMHRLHDVLKFFETSLKNRIVKN